MLCDPLCVVGAIHAQSLTLSAPKKGRVVTTGEERGKLLVEDASHDNDGFFHIVESVCQERVIQEFRQTLLDNVAFHQSGAYRESSA